MRKRIAAVVTVLALVGFPLLGTACSKSPMPAPFPKLYCITLEVCGNAANAGWM